jgi:alginate O-acetyltransferase complex protein AlgI
MSFKSSFFLIFFPITLLAYHLVPVRWKTTLLLVASYVFYMAWEWTYGALLLATTIVDFFVARQLELSPPRQKKLLLGGALTCHLCLLFVFKYFDFLLELSGSPIEPLRLLLPVGLSFYTFQAMGYLIDVYRGEEKAVQDFRLYALFISYFPQLVAGPIERARQLVPQLASYRSPERKELDQAFQLLALGFFKKVVIADGLSRYVAHAFGHPALMSPAVTTIGWLAFTTQVYCDFSGYSDIARGAALCLGHKLSVNFSRPYLAQSFRDLVRRWHITLGDLFFRHIYLPLGGSQLGALRTSGNLILVMLLSGLWHGAGLNFLAWGGSIALFLILEKILGLHRLPALLGWIWAIGAWTFNSMFFRINHLADAQYFLCNLLRLGEVTSEGWLRALAPFTGDGHFLAVALTSLCMMLLLTGVELLEEKKRKLSLAWAWFMVVLTILFGVYDEVSFIYYQF